VRVLKARDDEPAELAGQLWDLCGWADTGRRLLDEMAVNIQTTDVPSRFVVAAAMVRHLLTDPMLPAELLPVDWPGAALRASYHDFAKELSERRDMTQLLEAT
jgi:phenylacetic acid degradation operon negative regulatory protein